MSSQQQCCLSLLTTCSPYRVKAQYFTLTVAVQHVSACSASDRKDLQVDLLYDTGEVVPPSRGQSSFDYRVFWAASDQAQLSVRINELSHAHRNHLFVLRIRHGAHAEVSTPPTRVLSKTCIVKAHLEGKPYVAPKRKRSDTGATAVGTPTATAAADSSDEFSGASEALLPAPPQSGGSELRSTHRDRREVTERNVRLHTELADLRQRCIEQEQQAASLMAEVSEQSRTLRRELEDLTAAVRAISSALFVFSPTEPVTLPSVSGAEFLMGESGELVDESCVGGSDLMSFL